MVVCHKTFGPDLVARAIASKNNNEDTFNHSVLYSHISTYGAVSAYDGKYLDTWRRATPSVFRAVENTMRYRSFLIIDDDGRIDLNEADHPGEMENTQHLVSIINRRTSLGKLRDCRFGHWKNVFHK